MSVYQELYVELAARRNTMLFLNKKQNSRLITKQKKEKHGRELTAKQKNTKQTITHPCYVLERSQCIKKNR